jgi:pimeloyl-ACP methyl ester carboxylesterase
MTKDLSYIQQGHGNALVLLHGYLENKEMWEDLLSKLPKSTSVICPDLPGHGDSGVLENQTIDNMGKAIFHLLDDLGIKQFSLAGHSMGGYVALAMAEQQPERVTRIALLHSHTYADLPEKAANRLRETHLVGRGKKELIIRTAIPNLFAPAFAKKHPDVVNKTIEIALTTPPEGMVACLKAMAERPDRTAFFKSLPIDRWLILGKNDNLISWQTLSDEFASIPGIKISVLENAGHMSMKEEPEAFLQMIQPLFL